MPRGEFLGEFEQVPLLAVVRLDDGAYGIAIRDEIDGRTGREVSIGSVYSALDRMERRGFVAPRLARLLLTLLLPERYCDQQVGDLREGFPARVAWGALRTGGDRIRHRPSLCAPTGHLHGAMVLRALQAT